jgi:hypothetical protein
MNEAETRAEHIDPALRAAGWGVVEGSRVRREFITPGRLLGGGQHSKPEIADYVLFYKNRKLAVIEAKRWGLPHTEGLPQAKQYAHKLGVRFTYSTNGQRIYGVDMATGKEGDVAAYPSPEELWKMTFANANDWRDRFAEIPFEDRGGTWGSRYYQDIAVNNVLEARPSSRFNWRGSCFMHVGTCLIGRRTASHRAARVCYSLPTATFSPTRLITRSPLSLRMRWCASRRMTYARRGACRRTAASSSPSSRRS